MEFMKNKYKCFSLFSGGLDSILAVLHMRKLGYEVIPVFFQTPFFSAENALKAAENADIQIRVIDITTDYIKMLENPAYGFGKNMNPCIDCHGLMFRKAGEMMEAEQVDFLISGEVLGQRPMSQRYDALNSVGKLSNVKDLLIRPLSQKLLVDTLPVREGWVKKEEMLDIQGRGRQRQIKMAKEFGISHYQNPGGGCLLTDQGFSRRLKDLIRYKMFTVNNIRLLKLGRHFRLNPNCKFIVGKNNNDNEKINQLAAEGVIFQTVNQPGPLGLMISLAEIDAYEIEQAASILLRYSNKASTEDVVSFGNGTESDEQIKITKMEERSVVKLMI
jgi:tRNA-uridine 2-sulfurtransferase